MGYVVLIRDLDHNRIQTIQRIADNEGLGDALGGFFVKAREQVDVLENGVDERTLEVAIAAFKNLQHIRLLRVQDQLDVQFLSYLKGRRDMVQNHNLQLEWNSELRAAGTLGRAVLSSRSPATLWPTRWSFPLIDVHSAMPLSNNPSAYLTSMVARLECLSLRFENSADLDTNLKQLAPLFRTVFYPGSGLISVHIGFPQQAVSIPLEDVFQNVRLEKLRVFSIGGWRLDAEEIVNLARRYRTSLRGLRLHGVLLKDGSVWRDVLKVLRREMQSLQWLSLSKADYATHFDQNAALMDVTEDSDIGPADDDDDSSSEGDLDDDMIDHFYGEGEASEPGDDDHQYESSSSDDEARPDSDTDSVSDLDPAAHAFTMHVEAPDYEHVCTCSLFGHLEDVDDLGDNGTYVTPRQRKLWESWVVGCLVHRSRRLGLSNHTGFSEPTGRLP